MKKFLAEIGYLNVVEANDGAEAVALVDEQAIDFVFMDIVMKEMNGDLALAKIRQNHPYLPVVMLSSVTDHRLVETCERMGISGFIFKPLNSVNAAKELEKYLKIA
jgi:CheY-like chemotaxis protein